MTDLPPQDEPAVQPGTQWVSFVDEHDETWMFDLAYFRSNWNCIYGSGCAGIEAEPNVEAHRGCCSFGAHFADDADLVRVMDVAAALPQDVWERHGERPPLSGDRASDFDALVNALTIVDDDGDRVTKVVDGACVFQNRPGSATGPGCAIHFAAEATELDPLEWKPEVCWQLPIRVEHHLDDNDQSTHLVRQWTRSDWGEAGQDLGWWCSEAPEAYSGAKPVAHYLRAEIAALAGVSIADALIAHVEGSGTIVSLPLPTRR